jgi:hypothetical protein
MPVNCVLKPFSVLKILGLASFTNTLMISYGFVMKGAVTKVFPQALVGKSCCKRLSPPEGELQSNADQVVLEKTAMGLQAPVADAMDLTRVPDMSASFMN